METILNPFAPVTPPPENQSFAQKPMPLQPASHTPLHPLFHRMGWGFDMPLHPAADLEARDPTAREEQRLNQSRKREREEDEHPKREPRMMQPPPPPTHTPPTTESEKSQPRSDTPSQPQSESQTQTQTQTQARGFPPSHMDPGEFAMATRIAAFYQQRCHAIASYQQQRCQAWANSYRQRCHETTQAATLVVAWYVRDRIRRRRRRQKGRFKRGLRERRVAPRVGRGEVVRRWAMGVPSDAHPADSVTMDRVADKDEEKFSMGGEAPSDRESKLLEMADGLIKNQYRSIEVPLMGVLSFDESESESEDDFADLCTRCKVESSEMEVMGDPPEQEDVAGVDDDDYEDYEEEELYEDDEDMDDSDEVELVSEVVHGGGTGKNSPDTEEALPLL